MRREYGKFDTLQNKKIFTNHTIRYCEKDQLNGQH